jgi:hypothetical protein
MHFKKWRQEGKTGSVQDGYQWEEEVNGEGEGGWIWQMYFVHMYGKRTEKPVEGCKKEGGKDEGEWWREWI